VKAGAALLFVVLAGAVSVTTAPAKRPPANPAPQRQLGVTLPWSASWLSDLDAYSTRVGRVPAVVQTYRDMEYSMLNISQMDPLVARGSMPLVTVEPWDSSSTTDPRYALKNIVRGDFDAWFAAGADAARAFGKPFYLRFAPEMNGRWAPWEAGINGNTPQEYVAAWRRVHAIFVSRGAGNAKWVWGPNVFGGSAVDFTPYYPGSDVVDVLALDGYNWGSLDVWQTYSQVFGPSYDALARLDPVKPVMIAETASAESGGDKAAWITSTFTREIAARTPRVQTVVWFDVNKETDWRVESSARALSAYRAVATSQPWAGVQQLAVEAASSRGRVFASFHRPV
jgi:beta-mannanase